jgi:hypothetical protein
MDAVRSAGATVGDAVGRFMLHPQTMQRSLEAGFPDPFAAYFAGRGGVLGDATADTVNSVFFVFAPNMLRTSWNKGVAVMGAAAAAAWYWDETARFGREHLAGLDGVDRLASLGERAAVAAGGTNLPLFEGWRAMPLADDAPARALQVMFVLRELRAGLHFNALTVAGIGPVEAHMLNKGPSSAAFMGWQEPYADGAGKQELFADAEAATNRRMAEVYAAALTSAETQEFAQLSADARRAVKAGLQAG